MYIFRESTKPFALSATIGSNNNLATLEIMASNLQNYSAKTNTVIYITIVCDGLTVILTFCGDYVIVETHTSLTEHFSESNFMK